MKTIVKKIVASARAAWRRRETERQLSQLDARMLKDIGLESWRGGEAAARLWAYRIGLY